LYRSVSSFRQAQTLIYEYGDSESKVHTVVSAARPVLKLKRRKGKRPTPSDAVAPPRIGVFESSAAFRVGAREVARTLHQYKKIEESQI